MKEARIMRPIDGDRLDFEAEMCRETLEAFQELIAKQPTLPVIVRVPAKWRYHNDEHGQWWDCEHCQKICRKNPHDKLFCSNCGSPMSMES